MSLLRHFHNIGDKDLEPDSPGHDILKNESGICVTTGFRMPVIS